MNKDGRADISLIPENEIKFPHNYDEHINVGGAHHEAYKLHKEDGGGWLNSFVDVICGFLFDGYKEVK